jgi:hypothetical protein
VYDACKERRPNAVSVGDLHQSRTDEAEGIDVVAELVEDDAGDHQPCHKHGWQQAELGVAKVEVRLSAQ